MSSFGQGRPDETPQLPPDDSTGLLVRDFVDFCSYLPEAEFLKRFPHPFLIQTSKDLETVENPGFGTISGNMNKILVESELTNCRVLMVTKRSSNAFSMMVTVGRAENNDIVIRNGKISKFHAYFNETAGDWFITDGNSSNGTFVNSERLKAGDRYPIFDRTDVSFSQDLSYQFVKPKSMFEHVQRLVRR